MTSRSICLFAVFLAFGLSSTSAFAQEGAGGVQPLPPCSCSANYAIGSGQIRRTNVTAFPYKLSPDGGTCYQAICAGQSSSNHDATQRKLFAQALAGNDLAQKYIETHFSPAEAATGWQLLSLNPMPPPKCQVWQNGSDPDSIYVSTYAMITKPSNTGPNGPSCE